MRVAQAEQWVKQLMELAVMATVQGTAADEGGIAISLGDGTFYLLATYGGANAAPFLFKLPEPLAKVLPRTPAALMFPDTLFLPATAPFTHALLCGVSEQERLGMMLWVGRYRRLPFSDQERALLERFAHGTYRLLLPFVPFYHSTALLRSWLEMSLATDIPEKLEQSVTFLLELLLHVANSSDGAIVLRGKSGESQLGVAYGKGAHLFHPDRRAALLRDPCWVVQSVAESDWNGWIALRQRRLRPAHLFAVLRLGAKALQGLVNWSRYALWLDHLVWRDPLTHLLNRRAFLTRLENELHRSVRYGYPVALLFVDLDGFKPINDLLGHAVGDKVLQQVARTLQSSVRRYDIVVRYGGDEFAIVLPATGVEGAVVVAERLRSRVAALTVDELTAIRYHLGVSVGVTVSLPTAPLSVQQLVELAERAARLAKVRGRNRIEVLLPDRAQEVTPSLPSVPRDLWAALLQYLCHSINNPVSGILGLTQIALQDLSLPPSLREVFSQIEALALRLRDFSHRLARQPVGQLLCELEAFQRRMTAPIATELPVRRDGL